MISASNMGRSKGRSGRSGRQAGDSLGPEVEGAVKGVAAHGAHVGVAVQGLPQRRHLVQRVLVGIHVAAEG